MADDRYYSNADEGQRFQPGTTVEAGQVDGKLDEITAGFQQVAADTDRSLKLPGVTGTSQELDATPLQRRRKVVGFDADGSLALLDGFTWRGTWTATTEYFVNDVIVEPATLNWYVARVRHVSDVTFATTNWNLGLDYAAVKALLRTDVGVLLEEDLQPLVDSASGSAQAAGTSAGEALEYRNQAATIRDQTLAISESGLPAQAGNAGKSLITDGTATRWDSPLPSGANDGDVVTFDADQDKYVPAPLPAGILSKYEEFTVSGTWTKDPKATWVYVEAVGGGGGGANRNASAQAGGGGGGAGIAFLIRATEVASSENITIGGGGSGGAAGGNNSGAAGGASLFGAHVAAKGGLGGAAYGGGDGGGGEIGGGGNRNNQGVGGYSSGGGGWQGGTGGSCYLGGGGGGGANGTSQGAAGGSSERGGNGGAGGSGVTSGGDGLAPGGGGGATPQGKGGNGADGVVRIWQW